MTYTRNIYFGIEGEETLRKLEKDKYFILSKFVRFCINDKQILKEFLNEQKKKFLNKK